MNTTKRLRLPFLVTLAVAGVATASIAPSPVQGGGLTTFTPGTPALASEVNGNFQNLDGRLAEFESSLTLDQGAVGIGTTPDLARFHIQDANASIVARIQSTDAQSVVQTLERSVPAFPFVPNLSLFVAAGSAADSAFISGIRGVNQTFAVLADGTVLADGAYTGPADFAEMMAVGTGAASVEPGDVMVIDVTGARSLARSDAARSTLVAGVYSTNPGFVGSERDWSRPVQGGHHEILDRGDMAALYDEIPLAVVGIVPCKVSAENGSIRPGDLLVTSSTPGHAMRDSTPTPGTIVGKALGSLDAGYGVIDVLVTLQ